MSNPAPKASPVIAIDGPAASGKGTLARRLADHLNFAYLDTGALYRAVGLQVLRNGGTGENPDEAISAAQQLKDLDLTDPEIRGESTGAIASKVAAIPAVRSSLLDFQRDFAQTPPGGKAGAILDGRDIGTVVAPEANVKLFITANAETRAKRRFLEQYGPKGTDDEFAAILNDLILRDERDSTRSSSPLIAAENAHLLDTTNSDIEAVFEQALSLISNKI